MLFLKNWLSNLEVKQSDDLNSRRNRQRREEIRLYLDGIPDKNRSAFDHLLSEYLSGRMRERLEASGLNRIVICTGRPDFRLGIDIEARFGKYYINLQIEPASFSLAFYEYGPDEYEDFPLLSPDQPYAAVKALAEKLS